MTFELLDYQILGLMIYGFLAGCIFWSILDLREAHPDMGRLEFARRCIREVTGRGFDNRFVRSGDPVIDD